MAILKSPTLLVILDGWGIAPPSRGNAITLAKTPILDRLFELYPSTVLGATGKDVGLEDNKMSGSEAGHMNIGAGRIVLQDSYYITRSIKDGSFFMNPAMMGAVQHVKKYGSNFHVMGLMGNEDSPHSDPDHFRAILRMAKENGIREVYCHMFTDGRDSYPKSALEHLKNYSKIIEEEGIGKIATMSGRFYAMDRTKKWIRLARAYEVIFLSQGEKASSPEEAIENTYKKNLTDEFLEPTAIWEDGKPVASLSHDDSLIFFNLRSDRARQLTKLFVTTSEGGLFSEDMPVMDKMKNLYFVAMTDFGPDLNVHTVLISQNISATLPMAAGHLKQMYTAESEKYAHVTYFLNGGYVDPVGGEDRFVVPSPSVESYDQVPEMSAEILTENVLGYIGKDAYDLIVMNYANADMVGHTGNLRATVSAVEILDRQIGKLVKEVLKKRGNLVICADHGNAEVMIDSRSEQPNTFHTKNPVPFLVISDKFKNKKMMSGGVLGNIAPSILEMLEIEKPRVMGKNSLLI